MKSVGGLSRRSALQGVCAATLSTPLFGPVEAVGHDKRTLDLSRLLSSIQRENILQGRVQAGLPDVFRLALRIASEQGFNRIAVPSGRLIFDSIELGQSGLAIPPGVKIFGAGRYSTSIEIAGRALTRLFVARGTSGVGLSDLTLVGNSASNGDTVGAALIVDVTAGPPTTGIVVERVALKNFAAPGWIHFTTREGALLADVILTDLQAFSEPDNSRRPAEIGSNSAVVRIDGLKGKVRFVTIQGFRADAAHIKSGAIFYGDVRGASISDFEISDAGRKGARDDAGAYAVQCYDSRGQMRDISILRGKIENPRSCGIYCAGASLIAIRDVAIKGQSDQRRETLPKAAIALNGCTGVSIDNCTFSDNTIDIAMVPPTSAGGTLDVTIANCRMVNSSAAAIFASAPDSGGRWSGLAIRNCFISSRKLGIGVRSKLTSSITDIRICDTSVLAGNIAVDLFLDSDSHATDLAITRSEIAGRNLALRMRNPGCASVTDAFLASSPNRLPLDLFGVESVRIVRSGVSASVGEVRSSLDNGARSLVIENLSTITPLGQN